MNNGCLKRLWHLQVWNNQILTGPKEPASTDPALSRDLDRMIHSDLQVEGVSACPLQVLKTYWPLEHQIYLHFILERKKGPNSNVFKELIRESASHLRPMPGTGQFTILKLNFSWFQLLTAQRRKQGEKWGWISLKSLLNNGKTLWIQT